MSNVPIELKAGFFTVAQRSNLIFTSLLPSVKALACRSDYYFLSAMPWKWAKLVSNKLQ